MGCGSNTKIPAFAQTVLLTFRSSHRMNQSMSSFFPVMIDKTDHFVRHLIDWCPECESTKVSSCTSVCNVFPSGEQHTFLTKRIKALRARECFARQQETSSKHNKNFNNSKQITRNCASGGGSAPSGTIVIRSQSQAVKCQQ